MPTATAPAPVQQDPYPVRRRRRPMIDLAALDRAAHEENARRAAERAAAGEGGNQEGQEPQAPQGATVEQTATQEQAPVQAGQESPVPMRCPEPKVEPDANGLTWPEPEPEPEPQAPKTVGGGAILDGDETPAPEAISWPEPKPPAPETDEAPVTIAGDGWEESPEPVAALPIPEADLPQAAPPIPVKKKATKKSASQ